MNIKVIRNGPVEPREIEDLRRAVGWDITPGQCGRALARSFAHYSVRDGDGLLIGYLSILSDGVAAAFLLDLIVHPQHRHSGIGTALVHRAIGDMKAAGVQCVAVTFNDDLEPFYARCGFHIFKGGIIDFKNMKWDDDG